jgi:hypothetical protein
MADLRYEAPESLDSAMALLAAAPEASRAHRTKWAKDA